MLVLVKPPLLQDVRYWIMTAVETGQLVAYTDF